MVRFLIPAVLLIAGSTALSADAGRYQEKQAALDQAQLAKELQGLVPGKAQSCIDQSRYSETIRVGDTILYKYSPREIYRTDTDGGCFGLRRGDVIVTKTYGGQLCRGDIVRTVDLLSHVPSGSCTFSDFTPYRRP